MKKLKNISIIFLFFIIIFNILTIKSYAQDSYKARIYIDSPAGNIIHQVKQYLEVEGWVMTDDEEATVKAYINGQEQTIINMTRKEREDVIKAIIGYGTTEQNAQPGFLFGIDTSNLKDGEYKLEVKVMSRTGKILATSERTIIVQKYKAKMYLDAPAGNNIHQVKQYLEVQGWVMTEDEEATIKAYLSGQEQTIINMTREDREDVINAITGYGSPEQNTQPGFTFGIDTNNIKDGAYKLEVKVISRTGEILTTTERNIIIEKYKAKSYIDAPTNKQIVKPEFVLEGWVMTDDENATIKVYIDGKEQIIKNIIREEREDVIKAIEGYGGIEKNPTPGFQVFLENTNINDGNYDLKIEVISREGKVISTSTRTINYENYKAKTYIDNPPGGKTTTLEHSVLINGWLMTDDENAIIKIYIDGQEVAIKNIYRKEREDVIKAISGYGGIEKNPTPGYEISVDIPENIKDGKHTLKVDIVCSNGKVIETDTRSIEINKYKARGYIDLPVSMGQAKDILSIEGWVMSTDENAQIKIYIDNIEQQMIEFKREDREDVIKVISGYGGIEKNPTPGYNIIIDIKQFEDGIHTLRVEAISREGELMYAQDKSIVIYNNYEFGIDVSNWNGTIDWAKVKEHGVDFAMIRSGFRGYGQSGSLNMDSKFVANMKGAIANNIDIGVYFYSQAITVEEAVEEADYVIKLLKENGFENSLTFPIVIDTEEVEDAEGRADNLTKDLRTLIVRVFCERIKQYGYTPMIYANKWWLMDKLDMSQLKDYDIWLAHYTHTDDPANNPSDYTGSHQIWQYTDAGKINGISTNVDLNISYKKYL